MKNRHLGFLILFLVLTLGKAGVAMEVVPAGWAKSQSMPPTFCRRLLGRAIRLVTGVNSELTTLLAEVAFYDRDTPLPSWDADDRHHSFSFSFDYRGVPALFEVSEEFFLIVKYAGRSGLVEINAERKFLRTVDLAAGFELPATPLTFLKNKSQPAPSDVGGAISLVDHAANIFRAERAKAIGLLLQKASRGEAGIESIESAPTSHRGNPVFRVAYRSADVLFFVVAAKGLFIVDLRPDIYFNAHFIPYVQLNARFDYFMGGSSLAPRRGERLDWNANDLSIAALRQRMQLHLEKPAELMKP